MIPRSIYVLSTEIFVAIIFPKKSVNMKGRKLRVVIKISNINDHFNTFPREISGKAYTEMKKNNKKIIKLLLQ